MNRFTNKLWQRALLGGVTAVFLNVAVSTPAQVHAVVAPRASAEQLQKWLTELDSDSFDVREAAAEKLAQAGPAAVDVLASGIVSESAETAWRSGASLERIAMTGDEKTLARITTLLDNLSTKGKPGLKTMAAEMHSRQKHFRHDRAIASLKQNGAVFAGDGMELGGGPIWLGGPIAAVPGPVIIVEEETLIEVAAEPEPAPAKLGDGILGLLERLFDGGAKAPLLPAPQAIPAEVPADVIPPKLEIPLKDVPAEAAEEVRKAAEEALKAARAATEQAVEEIAVEEKPVQEKIAVTKPGEPAQILEEFKELAKPIKAVLEAPQALAPPPALIEAVEVLDGADIAIPFGLDFIGGGIIGFDESEIQATASLVLGKEWRGGDDGLKVLKDLPEIWNITLSGAKITDASLPYLAELPNLNNLQIHNTTVTRQGLRKLREQKPELQIQARGEAMMGVNADIGTSPLVLTSIFPDSGAYLAGLRERDVVHSVDGLAVKDFADLTISIYGRKAGEKVQVEYERNGAKKTVEVTLKKRGDDQ